MCYTVTMKTLPLEKWWSGDGYGSDPILLKQVKRTDTVALYERIRHGELEGFEVFIIKVRHKGDKLPGGAVEEEDREVYPSAGSFGFGASSVSNLGRAKIVFDEMVAESVAEKETPTPEKAIIIPVGEFSTIEMAAANELSYPTITLWIKAALGEKSIEFVREERRNAKGKATKLYRKV